MSLLKKKFYDSSGNFDNTKIITLLKQAQKAQLKSEFGKKLADQRRLFSLPKRDKKTFGNL